MKQVCAQLNYCPEKKIRIVLVSSEKSFRNSTTGIVPEWGVAFAFNNEMRIVMKSPKLLGRDFDLESVITHEISHLVLQGFLQGKKAPAWLHEGFAMYQSGEWRVGNSARVGMASLTDRLLDLGELEDTFPWSEETANLAYAESFLTVAFIIQRFGKEALYDLMNGLRAGNDIDSAMREALGIGYETFKRDWLSYTKKRFSVTSFVVSPTAVWTVIMALAVLVFVRKRIEIKKRMAASVGEEGHEDHPGTGDDGVHDAESDARHSEEESVKG